MSSTTAPPMQKPDPMELEAPQNIPAPADRRPADTTPKYTPLQKLFHTPREKGLEIPGPQYSLKILSNGIWHAGIGFRYTIARLQLTDSSDADVVRDIVTNTPESEIGEYLEILQVKDGEELFGEDFGRVEVSDAKYRGECRVDEEVGSDVVRDGPGLGDLEVRAKEQRCTDAEFEDLIAGVYDQGSGIRSGKRRLDD